MAKFGELIKSEIPLLILFCAEWNEASTSMQSTLNEVASELGDKASIIKIDIELNEGLADALRIKLLPTILIYQKSQMVFRLSGEMSKLQLIETLTQYI